MCAVHFSLFQKYWNGISTWLFFTLPLSLSLALSLTLFLCLFFFQKWVNNFPPKYRAWHESNGTNSPQTNKLFEKIGCKNFYHLLLNRGRGSKLNMPKRYKVPCSLQSRSIHKFKRKWNWIEDSHEIATPNKWHTSINKEKKTRSMPDSGTEGDKAPFWMSGLLNKKQCYRFFSAMRKSASDKKLCNAPEMKRNEMHNVDTN